VRVCVIQSPLFDVFGVSVGRSSSAARTIKGAWNLEGNTSSTWWTGFVALWQISSAIRSLRRGGCASRVPLLYVCCTNHRPCAGGLASAVVGAPVEVECVGAGAGAGAGVGVHVGVVRGLAGH
jgi:hypothetical protein